MDSKLHVRSGRLALWTVPALLALWGVSGSALGGDEIGIFFDQSGRDNCIEADLYSTQNGYILLLEPTATGGISGWECSVEVENTTIVGVTLAGQAINLGSGQTDFAVGLTVPLPSRPAVELAKLSVLVSASGPVGFYIYPCASNPSLPDSPAYADGDDPGHLLPLAPRTMGPDALVAGINRPECIPEDVTWGRVKATYD
jgi:hypothetical protein